MKGEYPLPLVELNNGLAIVPSCLDLSAAESELINEPGRELILKGLIAKLLDSRKFDYILIDCPPSLGLLTLNALTASDFLIIPVQAQFLAMRGMAKITNVVKIVRERLNPGLSIGGIVITQFDKRKTLNKACRAHQRFFLRQGVQDRHPGQRGSGGSSYQGSEHFRV